MRIRLPRASGFTLVEVMIVVAIIGLLVAVAVPNFMKLREDARRRACIATLGKIEAAKQIWGLENQKHNGDTPVESDLVPTYLKNFPRCPGQGTYDFHPIGENASCSQGATFGHSL
jgi:prepilin-type N-terminal cleavage/methylation domain-containing protein